jgi:hypothetical protein
MSANSRSVPRRFVRIASSDLQQGGEEPAGTSYPVWLDVEPLVARRVRMVSYAVIALSTCCCAGAIAFILGRGHANGSLFAPWSYVALVPFTLLWVTTVGLAYLRGLASLRHSIGSDGRRIYVRDERNKTLGVAERFEVYTNGEYLLVGRVAVPLNYLFLNAFDRERLLRYIVGGLPRSARISNYGFLWRALRAGNRGVITSVVFVALLTLWASLR